VNEIVREGKSRGVTFLTAVAGPPCWAYNLPFFTPFMTVAASLWVFAVLLWIILIYTFFASVTVAEPKPSLEVAINGSWLLVSWEVLHDFPAFYRRLYTVFWATGTWWISAVGFWRHMVVRDASLAIVCAPVRLIGSYRSLPCVGPYWLPILASPLRYAPVTALTGPRTLVSPALESRANVSGEASPEPVPKVSLRQRF
jgi:hypothetical protein